MEAVRIDGRGRPPTYVGARHCAFALSLLLGARNGGESWVPLHNTLGYLSGRRYFSDGYPRSLELPPLASTSGDRTRRCVHYELARHTYRRSEGILKPGPRYTPPTLFRQAASSAAQPAPGSPEDQS